MAMKIALACGGTGGHVFPALAVGRILNREFGIETLMLGRAGSLEERLASREGVEFIAIPAIPLHRASAWKNVALPVHMLRTVGSARKQLKRAGVQGVFATGGYVALPSGLAATLLGLPLWLLEPNAHAGVANRLLGGRAKRIFAGSPDAARTFAKGRTEVTGNPVRAMDDRSRNDLRSEFGLAPEDRMLLVLGGSQGAHGVNEMMAHEGKRLTEAGWRILWQTGEKEAGLRRTQNAGREGIRIEAFLNDVYGALKAADLCVSRSGAGAVAELALHRLPTVFVPYPHATDNHQETNARELEEAGAGFVLTERAYGEGLLTRNIEALWARRDAAAKAMQSFSRPQAAHTIASRIASDLGVKP
ncbi:MAG: hypothetical protein RL318_2023 [Fibrobacterota bacterium]|jgi:UDP-N-acetylglucosamine--N-acetylmuramyl-(pentapeptide) pyrophosphoryl-undecaprenol N-acetylglucosamine transferase